MSKGKSKCRAVRKNLMRNFAKRQRWIELTYNKDDYDKPQEAGS